MGTVVVVEKTLGEVELLGNIAVVGHEGHVQVTTFLQEEREGLETVGEGEPQGVTGSREGSVNYRLHPGEEGGVGGKGVVGEGVVVSVECGPLLHEPLQVGGCRQGVTVGGEVVRPNCVPDDQEDRL